MKCLVCNLKRSDLKLFKCETCQVQFHIDCIKLYLNWTNNSSICNNCSQYNQLDQKGNLLCAFCNQLEGFMELNKNYIKPLNISQDQFVHVSCYMNQIKTNKIDFVSIKQKCYLCGHFMIQQSIRCKKPGCGLAFHAECAMRIQSKYSINLSKKDEAFDQFKCQFTEEI